MEYSITNLAVENPCENIYAKAFAMGVEVEQRDKFPLVSVLLASYNHEKFVEAAVRSIMAQQGVKFELIVIDDGSKDGSPELLDRLSKELGFRYKHRENKGVVATYNELLEMAHGRYFCTFASDDIMPPGRLAEQSSYLKQHPQYIACFGQIKQMDPEGNVAENFDPRYLRSIPQVTFEQFFLGERELHGCSEMLDLEVFKSMGGFDDSIGQEDFPMMLRLLHKCSPLPVIATDCCHYRIHGNNLSAANTVENVDFLYKNMLDTVECYKDHPLYKKAKKLWKARYFSALTNCSKREALKRLPELASCTPYFLLRTLKLVLPKRK